MSGGSPEQRLINRRPERQHLRTLLGEAAGGTARFVGLVGEAGIAKSRLIGWLLDAVDPARTTVLRCQATRDSTGPLDPIDRLLDQLRDDGDRLRSSCTDGRSVALPPPRLHHPHPPDRSASTASATRCQRLSNR